MEMLQGSVTMHCTIPHISYCLRLLNGLSSLIGFRLQGFAEWERWSFAGRDDGSNGAHLPIFATDETLTEAVPAD